MGWLLAPRIGLLLAPREWLAVARQIGLRFARAEGRLATHRGLRSRVVGLVLIAVIAHVAADVVLGTIELRIVLAELFLGGRDQAEIMFGVLVIVFRRDRVAGRLRVAGKLNVFFGNVGGRASDFNVGPVRLVDPRHGILAFAITPAHALVLVVLLSVSHGSPVCCPFSLRRNPPRFTKCAPNASPRISLPATPTARTRPRRRGTKAHRRNAARLAATSGSVLRSTNPWTAASPAVLPTSHHARRRIDDQSRHMPKR